MKNLAIRFERASKLAIPIGFIFIFFYWWSVHPIDFSMGYLEDLCVDFTRQSMAENINRFGKPVFHSESFMAPFGASMPYMSWSIERDWVGAYFWKLNPNIPFTWLYFGTSLFISYFGVVFILGKMGLNRFEAALLSTAAVLFHIPRHFKIWHHFEHLPQHWIYLSLFLDAWIWQKFWRDRKISISNELWRGVLFLGSFLAAGYFWGPLVLEWLLLRGSILGYLLVRSKKGIKTEFEINAKSWILPIVLILVLIGIQVPWYSELYKEVGVTGKVVSNLGWFAYFYLPFRPLWLEKIFPIKYPFYDLTETVTSIGWVWIIPLFITLFALKKRKGGPGLGLVLPFLIFLIIADFWQTRIFSLTMIQALQSVVPFLSFFRVGTRWSLIIPTILGVILALGWPVAKIKISNWYSTKKNFKIYIGLFLVSSIMELSWLLFPVNMLPPLPSDLKSMLSQVQQMPGDTVLDLPYCVAGGNGVCTAQQCPNYPYSVVSQCLRIWHHKKIYSLYQARMNEPQCQTFQRAPYLSWFTAWQQQRCFTDLEWKEFCQYLDQRPETSAILLYPDIWKGAGTPECLKQFQLHLGNPIQHAVMPLTPHRGGEWKDSSRVMLFPSKCVQ